MTKTEFINTVNKTRLDNKNKWYYHSDIVEGKTIALKGFGTWLQVFLVDGVNYSNSMDVSVKQFKLDLSRPFDEV